MLDGSRGGSLPHQRFRLDHHGWIITGTRPRFQLVISKGRRRGMTSNFCDCSPRCAGWELASNRSTQRRCLSLGYKIKTGFLDQGIIVGTRGIIGVQYISRFVWVTSVKACTRSNRNRLGNQRTKPTRCPKFITKTPFINTHRVLYVKGPKIAFPTRGQDRASACKPCGMTNRFSLLVGLTKCWFARVLLPVFSAGEKSNFISAP